MPDYTTGKIYKLTGGGETYYGSTILTLSKRKSLHKTKPLNNIPNAIDFAIELVELFSCETKQELLQRERWWIENNKCINKIIPIATEEERKENKIRNKNIHAKKFREKHKDDIIWKEKQIESKKKYREANKEKINKIRSERYKSDSEYNEKVRQQRKEAQRRYRERRKIKNNL